MSETVTVSTWKPGHRHMVKYLGGDAWMCVDCRCLFESWPSDREECPGPASTGGSSTPKGGSDV